MSCMYSVADQIKSDLKSVSKVKIEQWKNRALTDDAYFEEIVRIGLTNEKPFCWRCSWVISKVSAIDNTKINPFVSNIILNLQQFKFDSQIGGFLKTLTLVRQIDEEQWGLLVDYCIKIVYDTQRPSHNKYYAIQLLLKASVLYPDLSREFGLVVQQNLPYFTKPYLKKFGKEAINKFLV
jgi:hypothetical protein